jgi:2-iminobutanoate/2-iminopropanoate deaminase
MKWIFLIACLALVIAFSITRNKTILTSDAPAPIGPYSQAIRAGKTVYVSGQIGWKPDGTADTSSIEAETKRALENARAILDAAGMKLSDVCKVTIYCRDLSLFSRINSVYAGYFPESPPARETVQVSGLPKNAHIEISMIAGN